MRNWYDMSPYHSFFWKSIPSDIDKVELSVSPALFMSWACHRFVFIKIIEQIFMKMLKS